MKQTNLKEIIKEEIQSILNEEANWISDNIKINLIKFWASADMVASNLSRFMDDMNKSKADSAYVALKLVFQEIKYLDSYMKIYLPKIKKELQDNNKL